MTEPIHRDCGYALEDMVIFTDGKISEHCYYCRCCDVIFTMNPNVKLVHLSQDGENHIDYVSIGSAPIYHTSI